MRKTISLLLILTLGTLTQAEVYWQRPISNFTRQMYHAGSQNWFISENDRGWMYSANNKGLLEYDGVYWNLYGIGQNVKARAVLAVGRTVYVGGLGEFGYFSPDGRGHLQYHSLSKDINSQKAINVWRIHQMAGDIYFQADNAVYVLHDGKVRTVACRESIECSGVVGGKLYIATSRGLSLLSGNGFVTMSNTLGRQGAKTEGILPYDDGLLVVNSTGDIFRYAGSSFKELPYKCHYNVSDVDIEGDILAVGTVQDGLLLLNLKDGESEHLTVQNGLQNQSVLAVKFDSHHNLWLGYDNGIGYIPLGSPFFFLGSNQSAIGSGYASCAYQGRLYLGTNQGVYVMEADGDALGTVAEVRFMEGTSGLVHCLRQVGGTLFCGGRYFFKTIDGDHTSTYDLRGIWNVTPIGPDNRQVVVGTYFGLYQMRHEANGWGAPEKIAGSEFSPKALCIEQGSDAVWVANKSKGLWRLTLSSDKTKVEKQKQYNTDQLTAGDNVCLANIDGEVVVGTRQGLFRYNITRDLMERHTALEEMLGAGIPYTYIYQDSQRNIWYVADGILHLLRYDSQAKRYDTDRVESWLNGNMVDDYENVSLCGERAIIGTDEGFAMMLLGNEENEVIGLPLATKGTQEFPFIRKMYCTVGADSLIYENGMDTAEQPIYIGYKEGSVRFEYGVANYDKTQTVLYSYSLAGSGPERWSEYTPIHSKEYTRLNEGHYTFRVRALVAGSKEPVETLLAFTILPPWYRTWWAYLIYIVLAVAALYAGYRRLEASRRRLIRRNEEQLARQQQQFEAETEEKDREIETLRDEKLEAELRMRNTELVQERVNIVRKNEMLQEIKKAVQSIHNSISEDNVPLVKRKISKLLAQIDTNLGHDEDVQAFQTSFDAVHHDFFKVLGERYPELSHKEKMMCAYIKMNMLTKEMAPLLNISVRGVEIGRYRLRKKLGLDERENLSVFLQRLSE